MYHIYNLYIFCQSSALIGIHNFWTLGVSASVCHHALVIAICCQPATKSSIVEVRS